MSMFGTEGGGFDMNALLAQAQSLQQQLRTAQDDLAHQEVTGSAGGDLVSVTMTGTSEVTSVSIKPEACDPADVETLEDLVLAAIRDAAQKAQALASAAMPQIPGMGF